MAGRGSPDDSLNSTVLSESFIVFNRSAEETISIRTEKVVTQPRTRYVYLMLSEVEESHLVGVPSNRTGGSNSSEIAMSPLVEMQATAPHTLTIRITPRPLLPGMAIRVSYERVPHHYPARHQQA